MFGLFGKKPITTPTREQQLASVIPVVKAIVFKGEGKTIDLPEIDRPVSRPFVADLMIMYAEDKPTHFEFISSRRLAELQLNEDELHELALKNLPSRPPKIEIHGDAPKQMLIAGGNFEATLLLYDDLWDQIEASGEGELLAIAPSRDVLFFSRTSWDGAHAFLTELVQRDLEDASYLLSRCLLRRTGRKWVRADHTFS
jgi:uncharacterized protein YtpQ (UPF0354 family)